MGLRCCRNGGGQSCAEGWCCTARRARVRAAETWGHCKAATRPAGHHNSRTFRKRDRHALAAMPPFHGTPTGLPGRSGVASFSRGPRTTMAGGAPASLATKVALALIMLAGVLLVWRWSAAPSTAAGSATLRVQSVAPTVLSKEAVAHRSAAAVTGALVADAATMGLHWLYGLDKVQAAMESAGASDPAFLQPPSCPFYQAPSGAQSPYGDELLPVLTYMAAGPGAQRGKRLDGPGFAQARSPRTSGAPSLQPCRRSHSRRVPCHKGAQ
jgi:hypothetical protein